jgi:PAS domain-containing protein
MSENGAVQDELTLRQIVDGISALVAVLTPDGAVETVNRQVLDYFGKTLEEMKRGRAQTPFTQTISWRHCRVDAVNRAVSLTTSARQRGADGVY